MPYAGLCDRCIYRTEIRSDKGSVFTLCQRGLTDPAWPKYPGLPVLQCKGYEPKTACPGKDPEPKTLS